MKKNFLQRLTKKGLPLLLALTLLSFTTACALNGTDDLTSDQEGTMAESSSSKDSLSVLDKGGANPTDNVSIIEPEATLPPEDTGFLEDGTLIDDLGDAASDVIDDANDGLHDLTAPDPSGVNNGLGNGAGNGTGAR